MASDELTDYVISDKTRLVIFQDLANKEKTVEELTRKHRFPEALVERELADLRKKRLIKKLKGRFSLTKLGQGIVHKTNSVSAPVAGARLSRNLRRPPRMVGADNRRDKGKQGT